MAFWNKEGSKSNEAQKPAHADVGRNDPCHCGSGKKYKKCCSDKDQAAQRKVLEENWAKSEAEAKAQAEKNAKEAAKEGKEAPTVSPKHGGPASTGQPKHQKFVPSQVSAPRKSGGG